MKFHCPSSMRIYLVIFHPVDVLISPHLNMHLTACFHVMLNVLVVVVEAFSSVGAVDELNQDVDEQFLVDEEAFDLR